MPDATPVSDQELPTFTKRLAQLQEWKQKKETLTNELKQLNAQIDHESRACAVWMLERGVNTLKIDGLGTCRYKSIAYPNVTDHDQLCASLRQLGAASLIKETIHNKTLRAFVAERLDQNLPLPAGLDTYTKQFVEIR